MAIVFPSADIQTYQTRDRVLSDRKPPSVYDILEIVRCQIEDLNNQKRTWDGDKRDLFILAKRLGTVREILVNLAAGLKSSISENDKRAVQEYLETQKSRWELASHDDNQTDQERQDARYNQEFYEVAKRHILSFESLDESLDGPLPIQDHASHQTVQKELSFQQPEKYPSYEYIPHLAQKVLQELREHDDITYEDMHNFYEAVVTDLEEEQQQMDETYRPWKTAVSIATGFYNAHKNDSDIESKPILVSILPNGSMHAGLELSTENPRATYYKFTTSNELYDRDSLAANSFLADQYNARITKLQRAMQILTELELHKDVIRKRIESGDFEEADAFTILTSVVDDHANYLHKEKLAGYQEDIETLHKLYNKLGHEAGAEEEFTEDDTDIFEALDHELLEEAKQYQDQI